MTDWLAAAAEFWRYISERVETFYKDNAGLVSLLALVAAIAALIPRKPKPAPPELGTKTKAITPATRRLLLDEVEQRAKVGHGLREAVRVDLKLTEIPRAVPVDLRILETDEEPRCEQSTKKPIERIFEDEARGRLLILGEPGTGKTNLMLELARALVVQARDSAANPIPILFNLARWTIGERNRTLAEWMKDDLRELYQLTRADAETLINNDAIIPLFDGLDEVDEERRAACVEAINEYQGDRSLGRFAVSCRSEEYERLFKGKRTDATLRINAKMAIQVERLTPSDVEREVARPGFEHVRQVLNDDPELRRFVNTPLWLHVLYLGALARPPSSDADDPRDRLYDHYVSHILRRNWILTRHRHTEPAKLLRWLGWLATEMQTRHQAQFTLESLDLSWLSKPRSRRIHIAHRILFGSVIGLVGGLVGGWIFGVLVGTLAGLRLEGKVEAAERLHFDWRRALSRWRFSLGYGAIFGLAFAWVHGPLGGLYLWLVAAIFEMLQGGFQPRSGGGGSAPNRATQRSLRYALRVTLAGGMIALCALVGARLAASNHLITSATQNAVATAAAWVAFAGIILGGEKGGWFAIRHYAVRAVLSWKGVVPAAYVRFLNEAVERLFLIRRGGSYEFIHLTFRDYMAAKYGADRGTSQQPGNVDQTNSNDVRSSTILLPRLPRYGTA